MLFLKINPFILRLPFQLCLKRACINHGLWSTGSKHALMPPKGRRARSPVSPLLVLIDRSGLAFTLGASNGRKSWSRRNAISASREGGREEEGKSREIPMQSSVITATSTEHPGSLISHKNERNGKKRERKLQKDRSRAAGLALSATQSGGRNLYQGLLWMCITA